jgi:hypothetical protein
MAADDPITEGYLDRHLHRPLAAWVLERVQRPPSLEVLTLAGLVVGLTGTLAVLLAQPNTVDWVFPAWLLFAFTVATRCRRLLGAAPDGCTLELTVGAAFWIALTLRVAPESPAASSLASLALVSALVQASLHAELRRRFLFLTGGEVDATPPSPRPSLTSLARGLGPAVLHDLWALLLGTEHVGVQPPAGAARSLLAGPMRMAALLGHGTHLALLYAATAAAVVRLDLAYLAIALTVVVGLNLWALLVIAAWRRAEALVRGLVAA